MPADKVQEAWLRYYAACDRQRMTVGDPYRRHVQRLAARERAWLIASALVMATVVAAFASLGNF